jgi:hypothetical protein
MGEGVGTQLMGFELYSALCFSINGFWLWICSLILFIETTRHEVRPPGQTRTVCILGGWVGGHLSVVTLFFTIRRIWCGFMGSK